MEVQQPKYPKIECTVCDGTGININDPNDTFCYSCGGTGFIRPKKKRAPPKTTTIVMEVLVLSEETKTTTARS